MNASEFVSANAGSLSLPPAERHAQWSALHARFYDDYTRALQRIAPAAAAQIAPVAGERRSVAQLVGHITAWERFALQGAADILAGVRHPRMVTAVDGFIDEDGAVLRFAGIDDFNAVFAARQQALPWEQIQAAALDTAALLRHLFTHPLLLTPARLERTLSHRRRMLDGSLIASIPMGWSLWITVLEHMGVEHRRELSF